MGSAADGIFSAEFDLSEGPWVRPELLIALACGAFVAYLNGANDVSKGIATLAGSGVTDYRHAILWGTLWTGVGGLASSIFSKAMIGTFGSGLLAKQTVPTFMAALAVLLGVAGWVGLATWFGLPVSTTHAIIGSAIGVYCFSYGLTAVNWGALGTKIVIPLLLSPVLALGLTAATLRPWSRMAPFPETPDCLCLDVEPASTPLGVGVTGNALACSPAAEVRVSVGSEDACAVERPAALRVTATQLHWFTSGAVSLARGLNDTPKIVALVLFTAAVSSGNQTPVPIAFAAVVLGMIAGSWAAGRRVTTVLAERVTPMNHREGFVANLVTAALVGPGAALGLPMSTTHVSSGAIIGLGVEKGAGMNWKTVQYMLFAWVVTVPAAAVLGVLFYGGFNWLQGSH